MDTATKVSVPRIELYGIGDSKRLKPFVFDGEIGTVIEPVSGSLNEVYRESGTLCEIRAVYEAGLRLALRDYQDISDPAATASRLVYGLVKDHHKETVTNDACDFTNIKPIKPVVSSDRPVRWVSRPKSIEHVNDDWSIELGSDTKEAFILVPESGFPIITADGWYRPDTGTPFATLPSRENAVAHNFKELERLWYHDSVLYIIERETSYWDLGRKRKGVSCITLNSRRDKGNFAINVSNAPDASGPENHYGVLYAEREGVSDAPESVKVLSLDEYNNLMVSMRSKDRRQATHIKLIEELHHQIKEAHRPKHFMAVLKRFLGWQRSR